MARPAKVIDDEALRQIETLAGYGLTEAGIAAALGMHPATFRRKKDQRRVLRALARGKAKAEAVVGQALYLRAKGGDVRAIMWWEKTRSGRSDRLRVDLDPRRALAEMLGVDAAALPAPDRELDGADD